MIKHLSITALTFSALLALTNPVNAIKYEVGDVLNCVSDVGVFVNEKSEWKLNYWKPLKFSFKIQYFDTLVFAMDEYFGGAVMTIPGIYMLHAGIIKANEGEARLKMSDGRFVYTNSSIISGSLMTGTCEKS